MRKKKKKRKSGLSVNSKQTKIIRKYQDVQTLKYTKCLQIRTNKWPVLLLWWWSNEKQTICVFCIESQNKKISGQLTWRSIFNYKRCIFKIQKPRKISPNISNIFKIIKPSCILKNHILVVIEKRMDTLIFLILF